MLSITVALAPNPAALIKEASGSLITKIEVIAKVIITFFEKEKIIDSALKNSKKININIECCLPITINGLLSSRIFSNAIVLPEANENNVDKINETEIDHSNSP